LQQTALDEPPLVCIGCKRKGAILVWDKFVWAFLDLLTVKKKQLLEVQIANFAIMGVQQG
jgi:hypothetical protein